MGMHARVEGRHLTSHMSTLLSHCILPILETSWLVCYSGYDLFHAVQASRDTAASAAAEQLRRDQLALKQSKQLIPILAPASKGKPYKSPAAAHSTSTAHANGTKTSALLNGGLPRKSSLESLGRMSNQVISDVLCLCCLCSQMRLTHHALYMHALVHLCASW